jgi:polyadenylate-binding protein 2
MAPGSSSEQAKEEADARSVYVGGVDYGCTPEELQAHFQKCGTVNRVTILTDRTGNPKGFAYIEFLEVDAVESACLMDQTELRGRQLKVQPKRTNVPGMKQRGRGRGRGGGRGGYFPMPMMPPFMFGYGYGYMPGGGRGRGRGRGRGGGGAPY